MLLLYRSGSNIYYYGRNNFLFEFFFFFLGYSSNYGHDSFKFYDEPNVASVG